ncbi:hypothetical protein lerEdw1_006670 [Lerista edwardsae]|nr:hypothetical protein lerEdw1_006670 [Lerista edwardsae]
MTSLDEANAKFAFDVFHLLSKEYPYENIMYSPLNLSAALGVLFHGTQCDTEAERKEVGGTFIAYGSHLPPRSHTSEKLKKMNEKKSKPLSLLFTAQATVSKAACEAEEGTSSPPTSGEDEMKPDSNLVASLGETATQPDAEEGTSLYFIPWRSHFLGMDEFGDLPEKQSSQSEKLSPTPAGPPTNQEEDSVQENMGCASLPTASSRVEVTPEIISTLLCEFKQTVKHADNNVQAFKETFGVFKECCDNLCTSMSTLQRILEALISILRE